MHLNYVHFSKKKLCCDCFGWTAILAAAAGTSSVSLLFSNVHPMPWSLTLVSLLVCMWQARTICWLAFRFWFNSHVITWKKKDLCVALLDDHDKIALISNCINVSIWAKTVKNCQVEKCTVRCISCATSMCTRVELEILGTRDFVHQVAIRGFATVSSFLARGC